MVKARFLGQMNSLVEVVAKEELVLLAVVARAVVLLGPLTPAGRV